MSFLSSCKGGWERENLARYLLSKISFISHPANVSDDLGSDFYCVLFNIESRIGEKGHPFEMHVPLNSFAIQIKSNNDSIDMTNKIDYLRNLEMPYFVGVIDEKEQRLAIYSGLYLDNTFAYHGRPKRLSIELHECLQRNPNGIKNCGSGKEGQVAVYFPKITEIKATDTLKKMEEIRHVLSKESCRILRNISTRRNEEYIFDFGDGDTRMYAGMGSAKVFRVNFRKRLHEVFYNLEWCFNNADNGDMKKRLIEEYKMHKQILGFLDKFYGKKPNDIRIIAKNLEEASAEQ